MLLAVLLAPVRVYQRLISPALPARCKYEPSCSSYAIESLRSYGVVRGSILAGWRLLRCNPWSHGGYDPVDAQTLFRRRTEEVDSPKPPREPRAHRRAAA
jgi:putative membrane protein insertion efficiency factor